MDVKLEVTLILVAFLIAIALRLYVYLMTKRAASRRETESNFSVNDEFRLREYVNINSPIPTRTGFFLDRARVGDTPPPEYNKCEVLPSYADYLKAYEAENPASNGDSTDGDSITIKCVTTTTNEANVIVMPPDQNHPHSCVLHI